MTLYALYNNGRVAINSDGSPVSPKFYWSKAILAGIAAAPREEVPEPEPAPPDPDWGGFTAEFVNPASSLYAGLYNGTATLVQQCSEPVKEHWANVRMGLTSGFLWNEEIFQSSVNALLSYILAESSSNPTLATLITDGNPPLQAQIDAWMTLANQYNIALTLDINP
jgi:hypothetical protein